MRSFIAVLVTVAAGSLSVGACSSGDDSSGTPASGMCHGDYAALTQTQLNNQLASSGACVGESDRVIECANDVTTLAEECGSDCYKNDDPDDKTQDACVLTCLTGRTTPALSDSCLGCYITDIGCARDNCLIVCGITPASDDCYSCRSSHGCVDAFYSCSGLPNERAATGGGAGAGNEAAGAGGSGADLPAAGAGGS